MANMAFDFVGVKGTYLQHNIYNYRVVLFWGESKKGFFRISQIIVLVVLLDITWSI